MTAKRLVSLARKASAAPGDPLVPLVPERLELARKAAGLSVNKLARRARIKQQTLDMMRRSPRSGARVRRCRLSHRDALARALDLPAYESNGSRWLGDEVRSLFASVVLYADGGREFQYQQLTKAMDPADVRDVADAVDLARYRFMERCGEAWQREPERFGHEPVGRYRIQRRPREFAFVQWSLKKLTDPVYWRNVLYESIPRHVAFTRAEADAEFGRMRKDIQEAYIRAGQRLPAWEEMSDAEREAEVALEGDGIPLTDDIAEAIAMAFIKVLEAALGPWFRGEGQLRYENLIALSEPRQWDKSRDPVASFIWPALKRGR